MGTLLHHALGHDRRWPAWHDSVPRRPERERRMNAPDGLPVPQRYWAMLTVALAITMAVLDGAIANVALPTIATDVHASPADSIWVVNAYQLVITVSLLPFASLGEGHGYRRIYQMGLAVFTLGSLGCALSDSLVTLTAARVLYQSALRLTLRGFPTAPNCDSILCCDGSQHGGTGWPLHLRSHGPTTPRPSFAPRPARAAMQLRFAGFSASHQVWKVVRAPRQRSRTAWTSKRCATGSIATTRQGSTACSRARALAALRR